MNKSPVTARPDASVLLRTLSPKLKEKCDHAADRIRYPSGLFAPPSHSCLMLRMCICGANANCPACSNGRKADCGCPRYIKGDYCQHCGAQKLMRDWAQSYISHKVVLVCGHCRFGFIDTVESRWRMRKFSGTNFRRDTPIPELLNPHDKTSLRHYKNLYKPHINVQAL